MLVDAAGVIMQNVDATDGFFGGYSDKLGYGPGIIGLIVDVTRIENGDIVV